MLLEKPRGLFEQFNIIFIVARVRIMPRELNIYACLASLPIRGFRGAASWEAARFPRVTARKRCGRLDEPIRHDMTDQFTSSPRRSRAALFPDQISAIFLSFPQWFTRVTGGGAPGARGVTLYNREWLPFDKPLRGAFNASLIEIGFRGSCIKHTHEIHCISLSHLRVQFSHIVIKNKHICRVGKPSGVKIRN